ncbi:MAG: hypothetical protein U1F43_13880 [Myxococcota bacterium]
MSWRKCFVIGGLVLGVSGCFGSAGAGPAPSEPRVGSEQEVGSQLGHRVRVVGEAKNTSLGATVVDDGLVVYVQEFRAWPKPIEGRRVEAVGVIGRDARSSHADQRIVLREASYLLME